MRFMTAAFSLTMCALAACGPRPVKFVYQHYPVPVAAKCVVNRPQKVVPMNARVPAGEWRARAPGAKANALGAQAERRRKYGEQLENATAGCP